MAKLPNASKYILANLALIVVGYVVYRYYGRASGQSLAGKPSISLALLGVGIYILVAIVVVARAYYKRTRRDYVGQTERGSEAAAYGALGANRLKTIAIPFVVSPGEFTALKKAGSLVLASHTFTMPLRPSDILLIRDASGGNMVRTATAKVARIDGVKMQVTIELIHNHKLDNS